MKKTIIITILLVYVASIVIVNFFGIKAEEFSGTVYVNSIVYSVRPTDENADSIEPSYYTEYYGDVPWYEFEFIPPAEGGEYNTEPLNLAENPNAMFIDIDVLPTDAWVQSVDFIYDAENNKTKVYFDDEKNTFIFLKTCRILVTLRAMDGSKTETSFYIYCKAKK